MMLWFMAILCGALLTSMTLDIRIGDNHRTSSQSLYLAEAGLEEALHFLMTSPKTPSELLAEAAGPDAELATSRDLRTILESADDVVWGTGGGDRLAGRSLTDLSGRITGQYYVFLRND